MAESWLLDLLRYLLQAPVRMGLVGNPIDYPWSSLAAHLGVAKAPALSDYFPEDLLPEGWQARLKTPLSEATVKRIEDLTNQRGRPPYGDVSGEESTGHGRNH